MSVPGQYGRPVADPKTMRVAVRVKCCTFMRHNSTVCLAFFAASLVYDSTTGRVCCEDRDDYASGVPGSRRGKRLPERSFASSAFRDHDVHLITRLVPTCSADPLAPSAARAGVASSHPASVSIVTLLVPGFERKGSGEEGGKRAPAPV